MFAVQPSAVVVTAGVVLPVDCTKFTPPAPYAAVYFTESAKYASSAVTRFRRSDFIEAMYAFSLVFANFRSEERRVGTECRAVWRTYHRARQIRFIHDHRRTTEPARL